MRLFLVGILSTSLAAASALANHASAPLICGTTGGLTKPSCVHLGSRTTHDDITCDVSCILNRRCVSFSYDKTSKICHLYTQSLRQQGFVPSEVSTTRYWHRDCSLLRHGNHTTSAVPSKTTESSSRSSTSSSNVSTAAPTCVPYGLPYCSGEYINGNGFVNPFFDAGFECWNATTTGCNPNAITTGNSSAIMTFAKGEVATSSVSQTVVTCNGGIEDIYFEWGLIEGTGCQITATTPPLGQYFTHDIEASIDGYGIGAVANGDSEYWGEGDDGIVHILVTVSVKCNGSQPDTKVVLTFFSLGGIG